MSEQDPKNIKELFTENKKAIVNKKESYYDKLISSLNLSTRKIDILIALLLLALVLIIATQSH